YVVGLTQSADYPTTAGSFRRTSAGGSDAFLTKLEPSGAALVYSTYLGGSGFDQARDVALDDSGHAFVAGETSSSNFPTTPAAFQSSLSAGYHGFVTKMSADGAAPIFSTLLGGHGSESINAIEVAASGESYVIGTTGSTDFPVTAGAYQPAAAACF